MAKRELIELQRGDKRYGRRDNEGQLNTQEDSVSRPPQTGEKKR